MRDLDFVEMIRGQSADLTTLKITRCEPYEIVTAEQDIHECKFLVNTF